jgi:hypothetical protein
MSSAFAADRVFFTATQSPAGQNTPLSQLYSMEFNGQNGRQHTSSPGKKWGIYRCPSNGKIFFSNENTLAFLNGKGAEEPFISKPQFQYHSPHCSFDGKYLTVTAWDLKNEIGYIELFEVSSKKKLQHWRGEGAVWMRKENIIVYFLSQSSKAKRFTEIRTMSLDGKSRLLYTQDMGEYVHGLSEPQILGPKTHDVVFKIEDEHESFYYFRKIGDPFILTRDKKKLDHYNVYNNHFGEKREQDQLSVSPDGKYAALIEHPWNTPPSLYLVDLKTRNSWKIAEGFNPVWSRDSTKIFFNSDPNFYADFHNPRKPGRYAWSQIFPKDLEGYEIYVYDLNQKKLDSFDERCELSRFCRFEKERRKK